MVGSVLLVEDVRFTRAVTRRMIVESIQGDVHEAASGQEALEALSLADDIEVVIADISMPGMSGLELLKTIRTGKSEAARDIPFIISSGAVTDSVRSALEKLDVTAVIAKPVSKKDLVEHLERIGEGSSPGKSIGEYSKVDLTGLLNGGTPEISPIYGRFEDISGRMRFLETVTALEGMESDALVQLAERAEVLQFPEDTEIEAKEFGSSRLLLIAWGEAEVLQTTRNPKTGTVDHRINLLEAGDPLGITVFMSFSEDAEHSQIRTTRPTEVLAFDFSEAEHNAEIKDLRDKVKLSVGRTLAHRLTNSDEAIAESLAQHLAETRIKRTAGGYVIMKVSSLAVYTLTMRALLDMEFKGSSRGVASVVMILVALLPFLISVRTGPFKFADLGLTLKGARAAVLEAVVFSSVFLAGLIGLKLLVVTIIPAYQGHSVFELAQTFVRPGTGGGIDISFYAINIGIYALFAPIQEVVVRCGLQCLIREFLYGSNRYRTMVAILVSNLMFAAAHAHLNVGFAIATFFGGLFFGWLFSRRRSIVGVSVSHALVGGMTLFALGLESFFR